MANRRIKYGQGKFGNVELVPQPSDDPDDPLVRYISPEYLLVAHLIQLTSAELANVEERAQLLLADAFCCHDWRLKNDTYDY